ncbi:hypothetical protein MNBD_IGNAVI01-3093 [hydrothermal vent metagenome]|uniref:Class II aldolase/adducin N-terminal domain-containing protein n=1 Tax=hydrothermal vent metagenome TaxID=652676 RepID=A0A3B1C1Z4_9ZZZZ
MKFSIIKNGVHTLRDSFAEKLAETFIDHGHELSESPDNVQFILNLTSIENPKYYRRKSKYIAVITIVAEEIETSNMRASAYTTLIKSLSNLLLYLKPHRANDLTAGRVYFTTPEAGFYSTDFDLDKIYKAIMPIASARFATDNKFETDLPVECWETTPIVEEMKHYGKVLNNLGVLPTPFPLNEVLAEEELNHLYKIFGITGASYGNLSARENFPELGETAFWMTGRGVDKSNISIVGKDVLLVKEFNFDNGEAVLSMPVGFNPKARVSVDAVEHALIYKTFPEVGAIVHVHAWLDDIICTTQNYPCGTTELAKEVVEMIELSENPNQTIVGLKNHGLTITGYSLDDIFKRVIPKLKTEVEMFT